MNTLHYDNGLCIVRKGELEFGSSIKPELSFEYDILTYHGAKGGYFLNDVPNELTLDQVAEVEAYIATIQVDPAAQALMDAQSYLETTDWIMSKITERMVFGTGAEVDALKVKYASEIQLREEARAVINGV